MKTSAGNEWSLGFDTFNMDINYCCLDELGYINNPMESVTINNNVVAINNSFNNLAKKVQELEEILKRAGLVAIISEPEKEKKEVIIEWGLRAKDRVLKF